jgi:S-DNA-T family DNA segregation ATPase FtsK/SpoIIIE
MTSYGRMRRQARRARRAGLQPVVHLNGDGRFPPSAAEVIARIAWRYRSELAPFLMAGAVFLAGWWARLNTPHWYPYFIAGSATVAWLFVTFGAWLGWPRWLTGCMQEGPCSRRAAGSHSRLCSVR